MRRLNSSFSGSHTHSHDNGMSPFMRAESWPNHFFMVPSLNTVILGIDFLTHELWGIHLKHNTEMWV
jgi:hypothetical protein